MFYLNLFKYEKQNFTANLLRRRETVTIENDECVCGFNLKCTTEGEVFC